MQKIPGMARFYHKEVHPQDNVSLPVALYLSSLPVLTSHAAFLSAKPHSRWTCTNVYAPHGASSLCIEINQNRHLHQTASGSLGCKTTSLYYSNHLCEGVEGCSSVNGDVGMDLVRARTVWICHDTVVF